MTKMKDVCVSLLPAFASQTSSSMKPGKPGCAQTPKENATLITARTGQDHDFSLAQLGEERRSERILEREGESKPKRGATGIVEQRTNKQTREKDAPVPSSSGPRVVAHAALARDAGAAGLLLLLLLRVLACRHFLVLDNLQGQLLRRDVD